MDLELTKSFFLWCTIVNGLLMTFWLSCMMFAPDLVYRTQTIFFKIPRETFTIIMYSFLAAFKLLFLTFNFVPYIALLIIS